MVGTQAMHSQPRKRGGGNALIFNDVMKLYFNRHISRYHLKYSIIKRYLLKHFHFATQNYIKNQNAITFTLYINNELAAFMSGVIGINNEYVVPRLSINDKYKFYSPGNILILEAVKYLIKNSNVEVLDLSQGTESYKYKLGGCEHYTYSSANE